MAAVVGVVALWLLATAGLRPLMLPDEGRYVGVAWEMLNAGQAWLPTLDGLPYFHKPPLFYALTAASMAVLGPGVVAARLASWLGALVALLSLAWFVRRHVGERAAITSIGVLATMPMFFLGAQFANMDMLVAGCVTAAVVAFADAVLHGGAGPLPRATLLAGFAAMAFGVLAKGLVGVVLPALVMCAWLVPLRRWRTLRALLCWPAVALFGIITLPWFAAMEIGHPGFLDYFVVEHHLRRYAGSGFNNVEPVWFYVAVLALLTLPWPLALAARGVRPAAAGPRLDRLLVVWFGVVLVFFSLPQSKPIGYVLPALPPMAAWIGLRLANAGRRGRAVAALAPIVCLASVAWAAHAYAERNTQPLADVLAAQHHAGEPVVLLETHPFDLAFQARLHEVPTVVTDWDAVARTSHDDWRHELFEAARFAPARAATRLVPPAGLDGLLCAAPTSWVIAPLALASSRDWLAGPPAATTRDLGLWHVLRGGAAGRTRCANADVIAP